MQEKDILGVIDLKQCQGIRRLQHEKEGKKHVLHVLGQHRDFFLSADNAQLQEDWFDIINAALKTHNVFSEPQPELKMGYLRKLGKARKVRFFLFLFFFLGSSRFTLSPHRPGRRGGLSSKTACLSITIRKG